LNIIKNKLKNRTKQDKTINISQEETSTSDDTKKAKTNNILNKAFIRSVRSMDLSDKNKKSVKQKYENALLNLKYIEYKHAWSDILRQKRQEFETKWSRSDSIDCKLEDFELGKMLGHGSFGKVFLVKKIANENYYALKTLEKKFIIKNKQIEHTINEKKILASINFPFITTLYYSFKDNANLFFVMEFLIGKQFFLLFIFI
jgi:hypothetical protein